MCNTICHLHHPLQFNAPNNAFILSTTQTELRENIRRTFSFNKLKCFVIEKTLFDSNKIVMAIEWHAFELCRLQSSSLVLQNRKCHFGCMTFHFICHFPMKLFKLMFFMHFKLTFIPNSLILNLSAINRSMGSTERSPKYTRFCSDNLKRANEKSNLIEFFWNEYFSLVMRYTIMKTSHLQIKHSWIWQLPIFLKF